MTPGRYDLSLYRGDSFGVRILLWEDEDRTIPFDLTGATVKAEWRDRGAAKVTLVTEVVLPNEVDLNITPDIWAGGVVACMDGGTWDLEVTTDGGTVMTPLAGNVTVENDVTNAMSSLRRRMARL